MTRSEFRKIVVQILTEFAYKRGFYHPDINLNFLLSFDETEALVNSLNVIVHNPQLGNYSFKELQGLLVFDFNYYGFAYNLQESSKADQAKALQRQIASYYLKNRRIKLDSRYFHIQVLNKDFVQVMIPLNRTGAETIYHLIQQRKSTCVKRL